MTTPSYDFGYASIEQIAVRINEAPILGFEEHTPEFLAAAYAVQAQEEQENDLCEDSLEYHLGFLENAGAVFDKSEAIKLSLADQ